MTRRTKETDLHVNNVITIFAEWCDLGELDDVVKWKTKRNVQIIEKILNRKMENKHRIYIYLELLTNKQVDEILMSLNSCVRLQFHVVKRKRIVRKL